MATAAPLMAELTAIFLFCVALLVICYVNSERWG